MDKNSHVEDLAHIRSLMEKSSRFISLSGLSGVGAGLSALIGAAVIYFTSGQQLSDYEMVQKEILGLHYLHFQVLVALLILAAALLSGFFFTARKARMKGQKLLTKSGLRLVYNLFIPLVIGGVFCLLLMYHHEWDWVGSCTLIFYGLALINAAKYTLDDIRQLGLTQAALGLICAFFLNYTLVFWAIGFGLMHIVYGLVMYYKYER